MIILYGGSFNPPTIAHYEIAKYLINKYQPKAFIFVPVGNHYQKQHLISFHHRYQMVQILGNKLEHAFVSDYENQKTFKGTIETLNYYQRLYQEEKLYYVIGADNLLNFHEWIQYEKILSQFKLIVLRRNRINLKKMIEKNSHLKQYKDNLIIEEGLGDIPVSATAYRDFNDDKVVLKEVNDYIYKHQLYARGESV